MGQFDHLTDEDIMTIESELKDEAHRKFDGQGPQPYEVYRHYKDGLYVIISRSIKEDTLEPLVTYWSDLKRTANTRTLANFTEMVLIHPFGLVDNLVKVPRFRRVED